MTRTAAALWSALWSAAWRTLLVFFAIEIAVVSLMRYVIGGDSPPPPIAANAFAWPFLAIHTISGVIALLIGPLQFVRRIRTRWPAFHRTTGKLYVLASLIAAPSGFVLALGTSAGPIAGTGFALSAVLLGLFTWRGWRAAVERRFEAHRAWMLRSWAMIAAAITLRLMLPFSGLVLGLPFYPAYRVIAWLAWLTNLALVEYWIRRSRAPAPGYVRLVTA